MSEHDKAKADAIGVAAAGTSWQHSLSRRDEVSSKTDAILDIVFDLEEELEAASSQRDEFRELLEAERAENEADAELLSQFIREAGRIASSFSLRDRVAGGDYAEFCRLLEAVRQIDWIEK